jgi:long-chain acyl-CoA synthetase
MGLPIFEGYGLTETAPVVSANPPEAPEVGTIGPPLSNVETRLDTAVDIDGTAGASSSQSVDEGTAVGELLVRGPNVTDGYWNRPDGTADAFVSPDDAESATVEATETATDRWFRTGDLVEQLPTGYLVFRGRRKQLLVLSTGKNVVPGPIEDALAESPLIEQCLLVGDGRPAVGALVVPNFTAIRRWADREGVDLPAELTELIATESVQARIAAEIEATTRGFQPHERIEAFDLVVSPFTVDNGLLTPTLKKKRRVISDQYADRIDQLYLGRE